jgi:peptidoglycan/xylan/chitin deacetylase (PgdA/CDA1 family)
MPSQVDRKHPLPSSGILSKSKGALLSFLSGAYHAVFFEVHRLISRLENGMLIVSVDVDVGSKELGIINKGKNDANVSRYFSECIIGELEELTVPMFANLLDSHGIPATFAIRGQLTEVSDSVLEMLIKSSVNHDIGAHGYYHRKFETLSLSEAEDEIRMISRGMQRFGLTPRSFVFPRNSVAHLDLLVKYGYECYRDHGDFLHDSMLIKKKGGLWDVHPSLAVDQYTKFAFLKRILDVAVEQKLPLHLWFHLRDFGYTGSDVRRNLERVFLPIFAYAKRKERDGVLTFETMLSASRKARMHLSTSKSNE